MKSDYARIEKAIRFLHKRHLDQPDLTRLAAHVGLSEFHFQRVFTRWAGVSPKRYLGYLTAQYAKERLRLSRTVLDAAWDSGLSGPSRLHDLLIRIEAMTPGEYQAQGQGVEIRYGFHPSPFGAALIAVSGKGICALEFLSGETREPSLERLRLRWPKATFKASKSETAAVLSRIFEGGNELRLWLGGTPFQLKVWEALLRIPPGHLISYGDLARQIGHPKASRAVGSAVGANSIAYLIPCHRVIRDMGILGPYRWGEERKKAMIAWEASQNQG